MSSFEASALTGLKGQNVWVAGAGRSGLGIAALLKRAGVHVFVSDSSLLSAETKKILNDLGIGFEEQGHNTENFLKHAQALVISPGIPQDKGLALEAWKHAIPVLSEIEVCSWFFQPAKKIVGITGTNGKSTVTNYLAHLFRSAGFDAVACGNIGLPFSEVVTLQHTHFVLELSSYQLETTHSLKLDAALLLNIQNDHLVRYKTLTEYLKAKWRIIDLLKPYGTAVLGLDVLSFAVESGLFFRRDIQFLVVDEHHRTRPVARKGLQNESQPIMRYGELLNVPIENLAGFKNLDYIQPNLLESGEINTAFVIDGKNHVIHIDTACLPGLHNIANLTAASAAALAMGLKDDVVKREWNKMTSSYKQLAHRLEQLGGDAQVFCDSRDRTKTIKIFNDSKATNVESTLVAVKSFKTPVRILLGGEPKGDSYLPLAQYIKNPLIAIYPFGKAGPRIYEELKHVPGICQPAPGLIAAAEQALTDCNDGDTILLSPACASFDEFKNFEHRGEVFKTWAQRRMS